ncbi:MULTISPECIES: DUF1579 domain-containing protein [unclassified Pseudoxanthomonas]|uniref:DUF1579 domain-containing protein n=1 Tax=unclassified Pseudoxanthomonas TaxID=2645906 RepID=UPI00160E0CA5|nr:MULTISPECIES: DUF1579 domain-containing protein [unclassified Pseudoxanthomonas]MBB3274640.1 hypothetical protein [Pseudoxanthomonas sp. OG2]MBV7475146.1 DUF1579 domain-containing protein [Pseudoxanthomonas sp. PXM05]
MKCSSVLSLALACLLPAASAAAQDDKAPPMTPEMKAMMEAFQKAGTPGAEHRQLATLAGTYDLTVKSWHAPDTPPTIDKGTATRRMILGDRVLVEEVSSQMMGQPFTGQGLHGFDNVTGKHWSTWNDSMSTGLMVSEGTCDASMACTYTGTYHDPVSKKPVTSRMTTRWSDKSTEVFEMYAPGPDGKEAKMMEITYKKRP